MTDAKEKDAKDDQEGNEEDMANKKLEHLIDLFPQADPEFLHQKVVEFTNDKEAMAVWISEIIETKGDKEFPSRKDYEQRQKEVNRFENWREIQIQVWRTFLNN